MLIREAHIRTPRFLIDSHLWNDRYAYAGANHAQEARELSAFEDDLRMQSRTVAGRYGGVAKTVAVAQQKKRISPQILQRK